jgi:uncharacterized membrane protein SirB2
MMDFLIVYVVFGDMMLQQTTYNKNKQTMFYYLLFISIVVLSSSMTYQHIHNKSNLTWNDDFRIFAA